MFEVLIQTVNSWLTSVAFWIWWENSISN